MASVDRSPEEASRPSLGFVACGWADDDGPTARQRKYTIDYRLSSLPRPGLCPTTIGDRPSVTTDDALHASEQIGRDHDAPAICSDYRAPVARPRGRGSVVRADSHQLVELRLSIPEIRGVGTPALEVLGRSSAVAQAMPSPSSTPASTVPVGPEMVE